MKMAGIEIIPELKKKKKVRLVNYNIEVPFERVAPEFGNTFWQRGEFIVLVYIVY